MIGRLPYECESIRERLPEYAEGALMGSDLTRVEQHVSSCGRCQQEIADLRLVIGAVRSVPADEAPDTLVPRLRRALQKRLPAARARPLWPRLAVPVAILTGVIAVSFALRAPQQRFAPGAEVATTPVAPQLARKSVEQRPAGGRAGGVAAGAPAREAAQALPLPTAEQAQAFLQRAQPGPNQALGAPPPGGGDGPAVTVAPRRPPAWAPGGRRGVGAQRAGALGAPPKPSETPGSAGELRLDSGAQREDQGEGRVEQRGGVAAAESAAHLKSAAAPPLFAQVALVKGGDRQMLLALEVGSEAPTDTITLRLARGPAQSYQWRGAGARAATIPLPLDQLGAGPTSVPVEVTSSAGKRDFVLFLPTLSRLGEVAPAAPAASYQAASLQSVLADMSALTGLVILAEEPLDAQVTGLLPGGTPEASLRQLGASCGFAVQAQGELAFTLTHQR